MSADGDPLRGIDAYKTLQVDPEADPEVVQAAYRRLARKFHPDVTPGPEAAERMIAINHAWELLGDPARRAAYDASQRRAVEGRSAPGSGVAPDRQGPPKGPPDARGATGGDGAGGGGATGGGAPGQPFETVSRDWTPGRSTTGSAYDPATMGRSQADGSAGPPPGRPSGSVLDFGRYAGWSIGEIARTDLEYLEWLDRAAIGRAYRDEIDVVLRRSGRRRGSSPEATRRQGLFRRG